MKVGFLVNQLDNRGTGNAVYDYAHYNEEILGNKSKIFTFAREANHDHDAVQRYNARFGTTFPIDTYKNSWHDCDVLYHIKSGVNDGFGDKIDIPYLVHAVFDLDIHGSKYATISRWLGSRNNIPWVPHVVQLPDVKENLREYLGIPEKAIVYGRHGGNDTFDIPWAWQAINSALAARDDVYFVFLNTDAPTVDLVDYTRVKFLDSTVIPTEKKIFINTCDAMLHARMRGETFGIAVGEFAISGKPVLAYGSSSEQAHYDYLGLQGVYYNSVEELTNLLIYGAEIPIVGAYTEFTPENVMQKFKEVFLG